MRKPHPLDGAAVTLVLAVAAAILSGTVGYLQVATAQHERCLATFDDRPPVERRQLCGARP